MNVLKYECKRYFTSSIIWALSLSFFGIVCIHLFVSFSKDLSFFEQMLNAYSPEMLKAFGAELSTIKTLLGFYGFCFMYVVVAAAFQAMYLGIHVVGKELSAKTADFLYTKPLSRQRILFMKVMAVLICLLLMNVIYCTGTFISAHSTGITFDATMFFTINFSMFLTQCLFLSIGFLLACVLHKIKSPLSFTTGIVCAFFLLQMLANLQPNGLLSYVSILNYVSAETIMSHGGFELIRLGLLLIVTFGCLSAGFYHFMHRDIPTG